MDPEKQQSDTILDLLAWAAANKNRLLYGGVAAIVVVVAVIFFANYQTQKELRASEALSEIRTPMNPGALPPPGTADAYFKIAREHAGTKAAARALLNGAGLLFAETKYAEAQTRFESIPKEYPESEFVPQAHFGVAKSLDQLGRTNEAISKYEELRKRYAAHAIADEVKLNLGRLYEAAKAEEAFKIYDEILKANPSQYSGLGAEAGSRLEDLLKAKPELEKLRAPIIPPSFVDTNKPFLMTNPPRVVSNITVNPRRPSIPPTIARPPEAPNATVTPVPTAPNPAPASTTPAPAPPTPEAPKPAAPAPATAPK